MNRIVRERYPVAQLPEDLRKEFPGQEEVTLTLESLIQPNERSANLEPAHGQGHFSQFRHLAKPRYGSTDEIVAHVRSIRDEWDDRDPLINTHP